MKVRTASSQMIVCRLHDYIKIIQEVPSSPTYVFYVCMQFCDMQFACCLFCQKMSLLFFFLSSMRLPVCVCMCVSCNVWCVFVVFDKGTGWIASTLKPSTWPQRSTGNLNASFPFLLWKYLPLAGKNTYTSCLFTRGMRIPSTCRFSLSGKQILQAASFWCWNEKK